MEDVVFGYVHDFGNGEEWTATRGGGALLNGTPIVERPKDELEILSFEATTTAYVSENAARFDGIAHRLRVMGSLAISLCHLAAGRVDGVVSLKPARSVDIAAAQLLVREQGLAIELPDAPPFGAAPLDLVGRSRVAAAGNAELCANALPGAHRTFATLGVMPSREEILEALGRVIDPELRRPVTELDMVREDRDRRRRRRRDDRVDRGRLPASLELRDAGCRARRRAARGRVGDAFVRRDDTRLNARR